MLNPEPTEQQITDSKKKKETVVVLGATKDVAFTVANVVIGLERHSPHLASDYLIFHDGILPQDQEALRRLSPKVSLQLYTEDDFFHLIDTPKEDCYSIERFTHFSFVRYEMFNLLDAYHHAIWIDFDILIQKDISGILAFAPFGMLAGHTSMEEALGALPEDCPGDHNCLSGGVMIVSDQIPDYQTLAEELYQTTRTYLGTSTLADLGIVNLVAYRRGLPLNQLDDYYGCPPEWFKAKNCGIIHTPGKPNRLWNHRSIYLAFPEWRFNHQIWLEAGGQPYDGAQQNPDQIPEPGRAMVQYFRHARHYNQVNQKICLPYQLHLVSPLGHKQLLLESFTIARDKFQAEVHIVSRSNITVSLTFNPTVFPFETELETATSNGISFSQEVYNDGLCCLCTKATDTTITSCLDAILSTESFQSILLK